MTPTPEERALRYALDHRVVTPEQVQRARSLAAAGRAPSALAALAPQLAPQQRAHLSQVYQAAQRGTSASGVAPNPTVAMPPPGQTVPVALPSGTLPVELPLQDGATVFAAPPPPAGGIVPIGPPTFAAGSTLPTPAPGVHLGATLPTPPPGRGGAEPSPSGEQPGAAERIGDFEVVREIARGGVGVVYLARHPSLERLVALKLLLPGSDVSPEALERFKLEAQVAGRLQHPNIVQIHQDGFDQRGRYYFAMDFVEGQSLLERIQTGGTLPPREAARVLLPLAQALAYAHRQSVLHRDLKPHNVLIRESDGTPLLTDFGLAKDVGGSSKNLTVTGNVMGTPSYMPPEQAGGETDLIDRRSDVYSLGATLYHALTGQPPFSGLSLANVLTAVLTTEVVPPRKRVKGIDRDLDTICLTCLEKEPDARYPTAQALADDLERYLADQPIEARRTGPLGRVRKWARRNRAVAWTLGLSAAALLVGGLGAGGYVLRERARSEVERLAAVERARDDLAASKRAGFAQAEDALNALPTDAQAGERIAAALEALTAAQGWLGVAEDDPQARAASAESALRLARFAQDDKQWTLAAQALDLAVDFGAGAERVQELRADLDAQRSAGSQRARAILASLDSGEAQATPGWQERAVTELLRATTEQELAELLLPRFDAYAQRLEDQAVEFFEALAQPTPRERAAGEGVIPDLGAGYRAFLETEPLGEYDTSFERRQLQAFERAGRRSGAVGDGGLLSAGSDQLRTQQLTLDPNGLATLGVLCDAVGLMQSPDPRLDAALVRYLRRLHVPSHWEAPTRALLRRGTVAGLKGVLTKVGHARPDGLFARLIGSYVDFAALDALGDSDNPELTAFIARVRAGFAAQQGDLEAALETLDRALETLGERVDLLRSRCRYRADLGTVEAARGDLERLRALRLPEPELRELAVRLAARLHRWHEVSDLVALARSETAVLDPELMEWEAYAALNLGDTTEAVRLGYTIVQRNPGRASAWRLLAITQMRVMNTRAAQELAMRGSEIVPDAWELLTLRADVASLEGRRADALALLARAQVQAPRERHVDLSWARVLSATGDLDGALQRADRALEQFPEWVPGLDLKAVLALQRGDAKLALECLRRAEAQLPWDSAIKRKRYSLFRQLGREREAAQVLADLGLSTDPDALLARAEALNDAGDTTGALSVLQDAFAFAPDNPEIAAGYGEFLCALGRPEQAAQVLAHATRLIPDVPVLWATYGQAAYASGQPDAARQAFQRAVDLGGSPMAHNNLGFMLQERGEFERAVELYDQALLKDPDLVLARTNRATCRFELGDPAAALADLDEAVRLAPDDHDVRWARAEALLKLGRDEQAEGDLRACAASSAYGALCLAGVSGETAALERFAREDDAWVCKICRFWLGELTPTLLLSGARESPPKGRGARLCESWFYVGWKAERDGALDDAALSYRAAAELEQTQLIEHHLALARLKRLEGR